MSDAEIITIEEKDKILNPEKLLWPEQASEIDYLARMIELAPYILPHSRDRLLTTIRYPMEPGAILSKRTLPNILQW